MRLGDDNVRLGDNEIRKANFRLEDWEIEGRDLTERVGDREITI